MSLSANAKARLDNFDELLRLIHKANHHHPADYDKAIELFIDLYREGERLHVDDVRDWARERGWNDDDGRDLGEMAEIVKRTLMRVIG